MTAPPSRSATLDAMAAAPLDVFIIGGGVNGAGVVRDLALRQTPAQPLRIALAEKNHFSSGTSGRNSQLIHGGLRYLKNFEFNLVSEALAERATLLRIAPHLVEPLAFLIPLRNLFQAGFYGAGLALYDRLAGKNVLARHRHFTGRELHVIEPRLGRFSSGARFFDCRVHSARLVLLNIREAVERGAMALNYLAVESCTRNADDYWNIALRDLTSDRRISVRAHTVIDASGAWATGAKLRLVRGSHLVFPRIGRSEHAISYFGHDGRIIFFIPWGRRHDFTLVGTTDVDHEGGPDRVRISREEVRYLLDKVEEVFPGTGPHEPVSAYSSLRPLVRDEAQSATKTSREHRIWADSDGMIHISGGKYTTYRLMSEEAAELALKPRWPELARKHVTAYEPIAGNHEERVRDLMHRATEMASSSDVDIRDIEDLIRDYGVESPDVLGLLGDSEVAGVTRLETGQIAFAARKESVERLSNLLFTSTYWGYERRWTADSLLPYARELGRHLGWDEARAQEEANHALSLCDQPTAD